MKYLGILICITLFFSCKNDHSKFFPVDNVSEKTILIESIDFDSIRLNLKESSLEGFVSIVNESIFFIDQLFCRVYTFDHNGNFQSAFLGQGKGPSEISTGYIDGYVRLSNDQNLFIGSSWDIHLFDNDWQRIKQLTMDWQAKYNDIDAIPNPSPEEPQVYTIEYEKLIMRANSKNEVFFPIYSQHPNFNPFTYQYYEHGRILGKLNTENGKIEGLLGRRSPEYFNYSFVGHHAFFSYDIDAKNQFYISHEIDSLIYVYDAEFSPLYSFGYAGKEMDTDYKELLKYDVGEIRKLYFTNRPARGYYNEIKYIETTDILFRSYTKGKHSAVDGLQSYNGNKLIGDVDVPKGFSVTGYIEPFYYSNAFINEDTGDIYVYKFQLPKTAIAIRSQEDEAISLSKLIIHNQIYDFGKVKRDTTLTFNFTLSNNGPDPIKIKSVKPDCVCSGYKLSSNEILAGGTSNITIELNTKGKYGNQRINTVITANTQEKFYRLLIKGIIE